MSADDDAPEVDDASGDGTPDSDAPTPGDEPVDWIRQALDNDTARVIGLIAGIYVVYIMLGFFAGFEPRGQVNSIGTLTRYIALFGLLALALNLHWGYTGLFNIGVIGFMAIGIYTVAIVSKPAATTASGIGGFGFPLWVGVIAGMLMAALFGLVVALPALRLRADYLAIVTIAFSEIMRFTFLSGTFQTFTLPGILPFSDTIPWGSFLPTRQVGLGGGRGIIMPFDPLDYLFGLFSLRGAYNNDFIPLFEGILGNNPEPLVDNLVYSALLLVFVVLYYTMMRRLGNSPFGRVLKAIREDEDATQSLGKNTNEFKIKSFMLGCALMGLGGILWYIQAGSITPNTFRPRLTFFIWIALIIGGAGSNTGSVMGGAVFAAVLFQGPRFIKNVIENQIELEVASSFGAAARPISRSFDPIPLLQYIVANLTRLQLVLMGVALIWLMHNRPDGMLGHRKEEAAAVPLARPSKRSEGGPAAADGGVPTDGGDDDE